VNGLLTQTAWQNLEVIIIDNGSVDAATLSYIEAVASDPRVRVFRRPEDFNFSSLNNFAVEQAKGEYLGLLNNDISVIHPDWLGEMMSHLLRSDVGIVGAKLLYENETVQHAGVIIGLGGVAGHGLRHAPRNYPGYDDRLVLCQQLSCVTAACLLTKKSVYQSVGGLDEINLRIAFNDVDYCLKVREQGWKVIWTPFAELYHLESASRGFDLSKENINRWQSEYNFMRHKWRDVLEYDPYYNPNLGLADEEFALAQPPRLMHPWDRYKYYPTPVDSESTR
jgi:GT2 family glycosyltransferase